MFTSPADIFRHFCEPSTREGGNDKEGGKQERLGGALGAEKAVSWDPNLVTYPNDGGEEKETPGSRSVRAGPECPRAPPTRESLQTRGAMVSKI